MNLSVLLALAALAQVAAEPTTAGLGPSPSDDSIPYTAVIHAKFDNRVSAEVDGLLTTLTVHEGTQVSEGDIIGTIDDRNAQAAVDVAGIAFHAADERAKDDIEERYARAAAAVAQTDYEMGLQANSTGRQVISEIDLKKKKLDWERARLQIEKAQKDQRLARLDADTKFAEHRAAKVALDRRTIRAPFDGEVQLMLLHEDEWVNPGDPVLQLVQFDVMWVDAMVNANDYEPSELQGRKVTVQISLARGRQAAVEGRIVYVNQELVRSTSVSPTTYRVRAEVQNQRIGEFWLVRPGLPATMTIHVGQPQVEAAEAPPSGSVDQR